MVGGSMSFLTRLLQTTGLSLALMMASAVGVRAEDVTVQGSPGVDGADGVNPGDLGQPGFPAGPTVADAESADPINKATAIGGTGGQGGNVGDVIDNTFPPNTGAVGGTGGVATAMAATSVISGSGEADAISVGGTGGAGGGSNSFAARGGDGGSASSLAVAGSGTGNATASALATGGSGGSNRFGQGPDSAGSDASASSSAGTSGSGDALSFANATGGSGGSGTAGDNVQPGGNANASAVASATGGGKAIANAVATVGFPSDFGGFVPLPTRTANATSTAVTVNGAMAKAVSTINPNTDEGTGIGEATAKTSFSGVSVQSDATNTIFPDFVTVEAIAQGGSGQTSLDQGAFGAISTALPGKAYATTLIGGASNVAEALLGPGDEIFGTSILSFPGSSTFDFSFRGDLILGVIDGGADIIVNGTELFAIDGFAEDTVFDLGSFGSNIELTITGGSGTFAFGGAVPEPSTWAMMMLGFAGIGFLGCRQTLKARAAA
jgi:PEP-CTERM motif